MCVCGTKSIRNNVVVFAGFNYARQAMPYYLVSRTLGRVLLRAMGAFHPAGFDECARSRRAKNVVRVETTTSVTILAFFKLDLALLRVHPFYFFIIFILKNLAFYWNFLAFS